MKLYLALILLLAPIFAMAQEIIPQPNMLNRENGSFIIGSTLSVTSNHEPFNALLPVFQEECTKYAGIRVSPTGKKGDVLLVYNPQMTEKEGYQLTIGPKGIIVEARGNAGCFYGLQSLIQLLSNAAESHQIPCCRIADQPRYGWRGLMLDESRHFFGVSEVKKILDMMALHKLNKFHWHLTDSPGWRAEIMQYPLLTSQGAVGNFSDPKAAPKYYTHREMIDMVRYAAARYIEIIPEIDMPGHATAAAKAYPEFSGGGSEKYPDFTFHPGKASTYGFLTNILREVAIIFPSPFIHIGGDEVSFGNQQWTTFPEVKELMTAYNIADLTGVEHYFLRRMADSIQSLGKRLIGWDEVVTAGIQRQPRVMWWRHDKPQALDLALKSGYEVILCPRIPLYFDFVQLDSHKSGRKWQGKFAPIESVYNFPSDKFTGGISIENPLVKGIQANLWTETIHTNERLEFMTFPRLSALAEAAWTNAGNKEYAAFTRRMSNMETLYKKCGLTWFDFRNPAKAKEVVGPGTHK